ncbi:hypothetical protein V6N12_062276 [Hibiscus sabdariffa]|uniref:Retrotransposon Copia-like N-terminal domain-containing protein n=1 Tax=Hibiscus sabdariffa TaxID=183260 RepID=A0ABR2F8C6_9ROSI
MTRDSSSTSSVTNPTGSSSFDGSSDPPPLSITCHRLNGHNYLEWSQSVSIFLSGRDRLGYVNGASNQPASTAATYNQWQRADHQVMTWLLNSMTPEVSKNFLLFKTSKDIWDAVRETYSSTNNNSELFRLESQSFSLTQGDLSVTLYFQSLNSIWQQLDLYEEIAWVVPDDAGLYQQAVSKRRIFQFLHGLTPAFDEVRGRVVGTSPLPSLREVFAMVKQEESRRMLMSSTSSASFPESALASRSLPPNAKRGRPWCDHCKKPGHVIRKCWKLHGKPADWKPRGSPSAKEVNSSSSSFLTKEQLQEIQTLFARFQGPRGAHLTLADSEGISPFPALLSSKVETGWIFDSGASDHMSGKRECFQDFVPTVGATIRTADGTLSHVQGSGSIILNSLVLQHALFVPSLTCNLISVSKLSKDLGCSLLFHDSGCILQALNSQRVIGKASLQNGLYILQDPPLSPRYSVSTSLSTVSNSDSVMLWHKRLVTFGALPELRMLTTALGL